MEKEVTYKTLRDEIAIGALTGYLANPPAIYDKSSESIAAWCYKMADQMLKAREAE